MDLQQYLKALSADEREEFAKACGTNTAYLQQITGGHSKPGPALSRKFHKQSDGKIPLEKLRPDIWQPTEAA